MIIDLLNRMLGLIEDVQDRTDEHTKAVTEVSGMLEKQRELIKLLLERVERLEAKARLRDK